jgi:predicted metal-dependent phosphoesterase TrpH
MPGIDLHTHSSCSDGTLPPAEVIRLAAGIGLEVVALTDHDTTEGLAEAEAAGAELGVEVVPGIELSAEHEGRSVHVLAYWPDPAEPELRAELERLRDERLGRAAGMIDKLRELGIEVSLERVREIAGGGPIVRPHIAQALVEVGAVASEQEAFDRYIADGGPAYVEKHALHPVDAVGLILRAGGVCVLAHPGLFDDRSGTGVPEEVIEAMAAAGMQGLEVDHPEHEPEDRERYRLLASRLGLVPTGGSDFHGERLERSPLGGALCDPEAFAELRALAARAARER